jgi:hypothetical protein
VALFAGAFGRSGKPASILAELLPRAMRQINNENF